jgi:hypothetical protein
MNRATFVAGATLTFGASLASATDTVFTCALKKSPLPACSYAWDYVKSTCSYTCKGVLPGAGVLGGNPVTTPSSTTPTTPGTNQGHTVPNKMRLPALQPGEYALLEGYRLQFKNDAEKGLVNPNEWAAFTGRAELDLYKRRYGDRPVPKEFGKASAGDGK